MSSIVPNPNQWFVAYHLASDVLSGASVEDIAQKYELNWMLETNESEQVFIPIFNVRKHLVYDADRSEKLASICARRDKEEWEN
ncbi:hypothetical protein PIB30_101202 [Stylosanthes scabra]|uniref:Uncharacterized protein n=1 Tax=Stylosanthes scabra TaxID=79078 RepID=A0ABU6SZR9_9FABA|nr:hypothetical protein [Stylosanthes scabra]